MDPEKIATAFSKSPRGVVITGVHGQILATNPAFCEILGYADCELNGSLAETIVPAEDRRLRAAEGTRLLAGEPGEGPAPARYLHRDGHSVTVMESRTLLCGDNGAIAGLFALVDLVPDGTAASASALCPVPAATAAGPTAQPFTTGPSPDADRFFHGLFEVAGEAIVVIEAETGVIVTCNPQAAELVGRSRETLIGLPQSCLHPQEERDHYWEQFRYRARQAGRQSSEVLVQRADGRTVPAEITSTTIRWNDRLLLVCIFKEIAERRRTEAALLAFANRMHAILSSMFDAVITADSQGIIEIGIGGASRRSPSHTTVRAGPHTAVRRLKLKGVA